MGRRLGTIGFLGLVATLFFTGPAWAYLDPGTGSMMLQLLLGGIAGAMVVGRLYWHRFRAFVRARFSGTSSESTQARRTATSLRTSAPDE